MSLVSFNNLGAVGIITDLPPYELPPEAWSSGQNARFINSQVHKFSGHANVFDPPSITPYWLLSVGKSTQYFWLYAGLTKVYVTDMASHFNLTRQTAGVDVDYAANIDQKWSGGVIGGIPILNNGVDEPQMWNPVQSSQRLQLLSGWSTWPNGVGTRANIIRVFRNFLIALDLTETGSRNPHSLAWSHPADPGTVPVSWNYADPTKDATKLEFADTAGFLVDCVPLGKVNVVYKEDATYAMQFVGGTFVFRFDRVLGHTGMLAKNCAVQFRDSHFLVTNDDIVVHNLSSKESILNAKRRRLLFGSGAVMDAATKQRSFAVPNYTKDEIWFCYPETGFAQPNRALVFNYKTGAIGDRDLTAECPFATIGTISPTTTSQIWDSDANTWDSDSSAWDLRAYDPTLSKILIARSGGTARLMQADETNQFAGSNMTAFVERTGLAIIGSDRQGNPKADFNSIKFVKRLIPRIKTTGSVNFYIGSQEQRDGSVTWSGPHAFNSATDYEIPLDVVGKFLAVKVESTGDVSWELDGYDLDMEIVGAY